MIKMLHEMVVVTVVPQKY